MWRTLIDFLKNPVYEEDTGVDSKHKFINTIQYLGLALAISMGLGILIVWVQTITGLNLGRHAMHRFMEEFSLGMVFLSAVVIAPFLEELLFRGPLIWFRNSRKFNFIFYAITILFGTYHITNFQWTTDVLVLAPLLVAPQISVGAILGFIRIRHGLVWAILLHACYNLVLIGPVLLLEYLNTAVL